MAVAAVTTFVRFAPKPNGAIVDVVLGSTAALTCAEVDAVWMVDVADISDVSRTDAWDAADCVWLADVADVSGTNASDCVWVADVADGSDLSGTDASDAADLVGATADVGVDETAALHSTVTPTSNICKHMSM